MRFRELIEQALKKTTVNSLGDDDGGDAVSRLLKDKAECEFIVRDFQTRVKSRLIATKREELSDDDAFYKMVKPLSAKPTMNYEEFCAHAAGASETIKR